MSHFFWNPYILQLIHFTDKLIKYKIFQIKKYEFFVEYFFQKSSLLIYKPWVFTISFYISQNIHFADLVLIKYKNLSHNFFSSNFFKGRLRSYINLDFPQCLFISANIYIHLFYKYIFKIKKLKTFWKTFSVCRLCLLINFTFVF